MTFDSACKRIKTIIERDGYKVILRYKSNQNWTFKFEKGPNQYDAIQLLYMDMHQTNNVKEIHQMYNKIELSVSDSIALYNLQCRGWKSLINWDPRYNEYKRTFESITGITIS